uniref:Uncharacterized protein n=1 Tax=Homo sapiens TaxID=9606 RepID=Q7Z5A2_HUMAN|nr:hypothetical protein [Homo sapiens]
MFRFPGGATC